MGVCCCLITQLCLFCDPMDCSMGRLLCPWDSSGKNTWMGCHFLLQGIVPTQGYNLYLLHWQVDSLQLSHLGSSLWGLPWIYLLWLICKFKVNNLPHAALHKCQALAALPYKSCVDLTGHEIGCHAQGPWDTPCPGFCIPTELSCPRASFPLLWALLWYMLCWSDSSGLWQEDGWDAMQKVGRGLFLISNTWDERGTSCLIWLQTALLPSMKWCPRASPPRRLSLQGPGAACTLLFLF